MLIYKYVNCAFSPFRALFCLRSLRFFTLLTITYHTDYYRLAP